MTAPNVLIIMTDQHRADLMTCAGRDTVPTPHIDRIAARGVRFSRAYCPYPVCAASRMSLLTGLYAHSHRAIDNTDRLDWRYRTMAHHFADHGYLTGLIGKMHFNDAMKHGFAYYLSINDWLMYLGPKARHYAQETANHPIAPIFFDTLIDDGSGFPDIAGVWDGPSPWVGEVERTGFSDMTSYLEAEDHLDAFIMRETCKFLREYGGQRFFLVASFMKPHPPLYPPREYAARYPVRDMVLPEVGDIAQYPGRIQGMINGYQRLGEERLRAHRAGYYGNLAFADDCVGSVLDTLEAEGLAGNTILVYTSDHGDLDGDHGMFQKFCLFEPSVRVPLMVSYPGHLPEGAVAEALTEHFGLYPTLCDLADLPRPEATTLVPLPGAPDALEAESFAEILRQPDLPGPEAVFSEFGLRSPVPEYMVRTRQWKYVHRANGEVELYNHQSDPGETVNLGAAPASAGVRREMLDRLEEWYPAATTVHGA